MGEFDAIQQNEPLVTRQPRNIRKLGLIITPLVILIGLGVWLVFAHETKKNSLPQLSQQALMKQVNLDNSLGKYQQAIDLIKSQKNSDSIANQTFLASVYVNKKEYQNALDIFAVINQQGQTTQSLAENAASVAQQAKDYQLAINYYQQAKKLAANNKSNPVASSDITYYDGQIQTLEKQLQ